MDMLEYFVYFFQILLALGAIFISFRLLQKNRAYLGNQLLSLSLSLVAIYAILLFLYKVLNSATLLQFSLKIGYSALIIAVLLLNFTIQVLLHSQHVFFSRKRRIIGFVLMALIIIFVMIFDHWIHTENDDIDTLTYDMPVFLLFAGFIGGMLIYSMLQLYLGGIRRVEPSQRKFMWFFFIGLWWMILGLATEALSALFEGLETLFDLLLFLCLSVGVLFMALSLLRKSKSDL